MQKSILTAALLLLPCFLTAAETGCIYDRAGEVEVLKPGSQWRAAPKGLPVGAGDRIRTGKDAWCEILFKDGSFIKLDDYSETSADELKAESGGRLFSFSFLRGKALWMAARLKGKTVSKFSVRTPSAVCSVRGTDFSIAVSTSGEATVGLFEGALEVSGVETAAEALLAAGEEVSAGPAGLTPQGRLAKLMAAENKRYARLKGRVERLRKRLQERDNFIDELVAKQRKKLDEFYGRRGKKLGGGE